MFYLSLLHLIFQPGLTKTLEQKKIQNQLMDLGVELATQTILRLQKQERLNSPAYLLREKSKGNATVCFSSPN